MLTLRDARKLKDDHDSLEAAIDSARREPRYYAVPRSELDRLQDSGHEQGSIEEAEKYVDDSQEGKPFDDAKSLRLAMLILEPIERLDLYVIVVNGERRRYYLDQTMARRDCDAYNGLVDCETIEQWAQVERVYAWLSGPWSGVTVGDVFQSRESSKSNRHVHEAEAQDTRAGNVRKPPRRKRA